MHMRIELSLGQLLWERRLPRYHLEEQDTQGVHIAALVDLLPQDMFGRHILGRTRMYARVSGAIFCCLQRSRQSKIGQNNSTVFLHDNVRRLDVAMGHPVVLVRVLQSTGNLTGYLHRLGEGELTFFTQQIVQHLPLDILHCNIVNSVFFSYNVDGNDIRMVQISGYRRLSPEAGDQGPVCSQSR